MSHTLSNREAVPDMPNPAGIEGIEFIEYATTKPQALGQVLEMMGFRPVARHRSREILLYRPRPSALSPTGYLGRTTIMELLVMDDELRRAVMRHAGMGELEQLARNAGMRAVDRMAPVKQLLVRQAMGLR